MLQRTQDFTKPPKPTTPLNTPWIEIETAVQALQQQNQNLQSLVAAIQVLAGIAPSVSVGGPAVSVTVPKTRIKVNVPVPNVINNLTDNIPGLANLNTILSALVSSNFSLANLLTVPSTVLTRLMSPYEDYGTATSGSWKGQLLDITKNWMTQYTNHRLFVYTQGQLYMTRITSNTNIQLNFLALPNGVIIDKTTIYWIQAPNTPSLQRWGMDIEPTWYYAAAQTAPAAASTLVSRVVPAGLSGYISGYFIACEEANTFYLKWTSGKNSCARVIPLGGSGSIDAELPLPINYNLPADANSTIEITNLNAGSSGKSYQANLLEAEQ